MITAPNQLLGFTAEKTGRQPQEKLRILWLANYPLLTNHKGHPASWMTALADVIHDDVTLTIVTWNSGIAADTTIKQDGITYVYLKSPRGSIDLLTGCLLKIKQLQNYLNQHSQNFDLIHIHGSENQFLVACAPFDIPKVLSVQGIISEYYKIIPETISYRRFYWLLAGYYERRYCRDLPHFMCRTHWDTAWVKRQNPQATVHQVWEIIRPGFFSINDDFSANTNLLYVGGVERIKGFNELLTALSLVKDKYPLTKLIILGTKPKNDNQIRQLIHKLRLNNVATTDLDFRGMQDAKGLLNAYRESFCLVHPSYIDNSPNSVCEAQIAGLPVVASDVGGVSSLIKHSQTGLLTTIDPTNIASHIIRLKLEDGLAETISRQSRLVARERHNPQHIKQNVLTTYDSIYNQHQIK